MVSPGFAAAAVHQAKPQCRSQLCLIAHVIRTLNSPMPTQVGRNVVHGSDSPENGERETGEAFLRRVDV
jgi:hypothetical protein